MPGRRGFTVILISDCDWRSANRNGVINKEVAINSFTIIKWWAKRLALALLFVQMSWLSSITPMLFNFFQGNTLCLGNIKITPDNS